MVWVRPFSVTRSVMLALPSRWPTSVNSASTPSKTRTGPSLYCWGTNSRMASSASRVVYSGSTGARPLR